MPGETQRLEAPGVGLRDQGPPIGKGWQRTLTGISGVLAFILLIVLWPILRNEDDPTGRRGAFILIGFSLIPLVIWFAQLIRLRRKLGTAQLFIPFDSLHLGYSGNATYVRPLNGGEVRGVEAWLRCTEGFVKGTGKQRRSWKRVVHTEPLRPVVTPSMRQVRIQIPFQIPEKGPASLMAGNGTITWSLDVQLRMSGCPNTQSSFQFEVWPVVVRR